jgi:signal transduction histidine kinase
VILNLFFSEHITDSSLKDLKYSSHLAKLKLSEEKEKMKNSLALHVSSPEFVRLVEAKDFALIERLIQNWKALESSKEIELYNEDGELVELSTGEISNKQINLSQEIKDKLMLGYEEVEYLVNANGLRLSIQRKIFSKEQKDLGYLVERIKLPYEFFLEKEERRELIVKGYQGVVYSTDAFKGERRLSESVFKKGAGAFELSYNGRAFDVVRVDMAKGIAFFIARENLRTIVFAKFYKKYFFYFLGFIFMLSLLFYFSYYVQVFKPLEALSEFIAEGDKNKLSAAESSVSEIKLITDKMNEKITSLNADIEENKTGRSNDVARLVSSVAHELNNSLSYLGGNISYLKEELGENKDWDKEDVLEALESAQMGYDRIKNIVADLKVFSSKTSLEISWVDVSAIRELLEQEFTALEFSFPTEVYGVQVETDLTRIGQIVKNLIINAKQAYGDQKDQKILISFHKNEDGVVILIKDWAGGVAPEAVSKIFDPFFTTKKNTGGAGLGLAVSQNLAAEVGGDLTLRETNSEGTQFSLILRRFRAKV